jgi:hypothetical protein
VSGVHTEHPAPSTDRRSVLRRARDHDLDAIVTMFRQFVPPDENVVVANYLGTQGLWGFGNHSFGCITARRVCGLRVGLLGAVTYQDCELEHVNSGAVMQPSLLWLYVWSVALPLVWIVTLIAGPLSVVATLALTPVVVIVLPLWVRLFYRFHKSGVVLVVREGLPVHVFCNRGLQSAMNAFYREALAAKRNGRLPHARSPQDHPAAMGPRPASDVRAAPSRQASRARPQPLAAGLVVVGGLAVIAAIFLPIYGAVGSQVTAKLLDSEEKATVWFALEPLVLGLVPLLLLIGGITGRIAADRIWLWLVALGVQAVLFAFGQVGYALFSEALTPQVGGFILLGGGVLVAAAGVVSSDPGA